LPDKVAPVGPLTLLQEKKSTAASPLPLTRRMGLPKSGFEHKTITSRDIVSRPNGKMPWGYSRTTEDGK
jgi:hypothetical protein